VQAIQAVLCKGLNPSPSCGYTVGDSLLRTSSPRQVQWESLGLAESTEEQWKTCHFLGTHVVSLSVARLIWTMRTSKGCLLSLCTLPFSYAHDSPQIHHRFTTVFRRSAAHQSQTTSAQHMGLVLRGLRAGSDGLTSAMEDS